MAEPQVEPRAKAKKKKKTAPAWGDKCDVLFGRIVRAPGRCVHCGKTDSIQCAHGFSRGYRNTRWDERNAFALCKRCHMYFTHHPLEWDDWLRARWGEQLYASLRWQALATRTKVDAAVVYVLLKDRWEAIERGDQ